MAKTSETPQAPENAKSGKKPKLSEISKDAKNMAMLCHLLGLVGFLGPLVFWLIKKDKHKFIDEAGKEALNFQLSLLIYFAILCFTVVGTVLIPVLVVLNIIFVIVAAAKVGDGMSYRYPIAIRFIK